MSKLRNAQPAAPAHLTFKRANHGVKVRRGFHEIFLTWKSIRELDEIRDLPRVTNWLLDMLADGPLDVDQLAKDARRLGFRAVTLRRARRALGVMRRRNCYRLPGLFQ